MSPAEATGPRKELFSLEQIGIKLGLEQIRILTTTLGHPERAFRSIVVAGTNGKGSVTAMIERGLRAAGYRTGRYTSPHLMDIEERFAIDGETVAAGTFDMSAARVLEAARELPHPPSFFEATTAVAFEIFKDAGVDVAVLEVGLGGRLDATNVVTPVAVAITSIDYDHQAFLGDTLEAIAAEKAGVIKPGVLVVLSENPENVRVVVEERARELGATLVDANDGVQSASVRRQGQTVVSLRTPLGDYREVPLGLRGQHQISNAITAVRLLEGLESAAGIVVPPAAIRTAIEDVVWPGRLESLLIDGVDVLVDGAHNPAGARGLASFVQQTYARKVPFVVAIMRDKDRNGILDALAPVASTFVFTNLSSDRGADPEDLRVDAAALAPGVPATIERSPRDAIRAASAAGEPVVVAGSLYLAGEVRSLVT